MTVPFASGSCQCGQVRYELLEEPIGSWVCYCTECQKVGAGTQTFTIGVYRKDFILRQGELKQWDRISDAGVKNRANFCGVCGNRIFHEDPDAPEIIRLKTGTLENVDILPDAHLWTVRAPSWIRIPVDALNYETQPTAEEFFAAIKLRRGGT